MPLHEKPNLSTSYRNSVDNTNIYMHVEFYDPELNEKISKQLQKSAKEIEEILNHQ